MILLLIGIIILILASNKNNVEPYEESNRGPRGPIGLALERYSQVPGYNPKITPPMMLNDYYYNYYYPHSYYYRYNKFNYY
jgi:hypothetical protein